MLKATYICDLCDKELKVASQGHAGSVPDDGTHNYSYTQIVSFPIGWELVRGHRIICDECVDALLVNKK